MAGDEGKDDCELLDNEKKRNIAWKNALMVFVLFLIFANPLLYKLLGKLITGKAVETNSPMVRNLDGAVAALEANSNFLAADVQRRVVNSLGGVKISWIQHLIHSLLAAIITWLVTYYSMQPDKDRQSCLVATPQ